MICGRSDFGPGSVLVNTACPECKHPLVVHRPLPEVGAAYCSMCDEEHVLAQMYGLGGGPR